MIALKEPLNDLLLVETWSGLVPPLNEPLVPPLNEPFNEDPLLPLKEDGLTSAAPGTPTKQRGHYTHTHTHTLSLSVCLSSFVCLSSSPLLSARLPIDA